MKGFNHKILHLMYVISIIRYINLQNVNFLLNFVFILTECYVIRSKYMTLSPIGHDSYVSPFGAEALKQYNAGYNIKTGELKPDSLIKRHKERTSLGEIIGTSALILLTGLGIYKGRDNIKNAFSFIKESAEKNYGNLKQKDIKGSIKNNTQKAADTLHSGFTTVKSGIKSAYSSIKKKTDSLSVTGTIKHYAAKAGNFIKSIPNKISNLVKKFINNGKNYE